MTIYGVVLFLHILAAIGIVAGSCLQHYFHSRMLRARSLDTLTEWLGANKAISKLMPVFALLLLACGAYMTFAHWDWQQPWIIVSLALLIAISLAAPLLLEPSMRAVGQAAARGESLDTIARLLTAPMPSLAGGVFTLEALAIVLLMASKPGLAPSLIIVGVAAALGVVAGWPRPHTRPAAEPARAESRAGGAR